MSELLKDKNVGFIYFDESGKEKVIKEIQKPDTGYIIVISNSI